MNEKHIEYSINFGTNFKFENPGSKSSGWGGKFPGLNGLAPDRSPIVDDPFSGGDKVLKTWHLKHLWDEGKDEYYYEEE